MSKIFLLQPATVQAYFRLKRPASEVASHKGRLEDDIFRSLRLSNTNVLKHFLENLYNVVF